MAALHLDACDFTQLTASDWSQVLALRPDLVDKFESIERDWSKDDETDDFANRSLGVGMADGLDLKSKGRKVWVAESPSGHRSPRSFLM